MNRQQAHMEQVVALVLLAYSLGVLIGERLRDEWCAETPMRHARARRGVRALVQAARRKWRTYSGLFVLLKLPLDWTPARFKRVLRQARAQFRALLCPPVRSFV